MVEFMSLRLAPFVFYDSMFRNRLWWFVLGRWVLFPLNVNIMEHIIDMLKASVE